MNAFLRVVAVAVLALGASLAARAIASDRLAVPLTSADGKPVGEVTLRQTPHGVLVTADVRDLPPGEHGFHVHEKGECTPPFKSAGEHFNPKGAGHGYENPKGAHAGDLPNLLIPEDGDLKVEFIAKGLTLERGKANSLLDRDGSALVVHAGADDYRSDPSGNSGDRIACGAIAAGDSTRTSAR
jgi:superoxide dismutase, Cu-Zn family